MVMVVLLLGLWLLLGCVNELYGTSFIKKLIIRVKSGKLLTFAKKICQTNVANYCTVVVRNDTFHQFKAANTLNFRRNLNVNFIYGVD